MKKTYIYSLLTLLIFPFGEIVAQYSQYSSLSRYIGKGHIAILDSAKTRISYSLNYVPDSTNLQKVMKDRKVLLIGDEWMHFYSYYVRQADSAATANVDKGKTHARFKMPSGVAEEGYEVFTHVPTNKRTVLEPITDLSIYRYEEPVETPRWIISDETCTILSYPCQKATTRFRGREWTVWFSSAIPLNTGPWKLSGLPGLILKATDSKGHYLFECIGIEQLKKMKQPIIMLQHSSTYVKCTRAEYRKAQKQFYDNYVNTLLSLGFNVFIEDNSGKMVEFLKTQNTMFEERNVMWGISVNIADRYKKTPYNPIELE